MPGADGSIRIDTQIDESKLTGQLSALEKNLGGMFGNVSKVITATTAAATAAIAAFAVDSTQTFAEFENGMNEVFTLLPGITDDAMSEMEDQVLEFSKEFKKLPEEVVPALYQSLSAGVPQDNVFEFLETANKLAKGGVTELETAVDGLSSIVNAYGSDVISATEASDLMFTAVKLGKTTVDELSSSLFNVIPTASAAGVGFDSISAAMAALTAQGTPTSVATTQMRQLLVELTKAETAGEAAIRNVTDGGTLEDFLAEGNTLIDALEVLQDSAEKSGLRLQDMFGSVEAGSAALALMSGEGEVFLNNLDEMQGAAGATEAAFEQMDQGITATAEDIAARVEVLKISFGDELAPAVEEGAFAILDTIEQLTPAFGNIATGIVGVFNGSSEGAAMLAEGVGEIVNTLLETLLTAAPTIVMAASQLLLGVAKSFSDALPEIGTAIKAIIPIVIDTLLFLAPEVFKIGVGVILSLVQGITDYIPDLIETLKEIIPEMLFTFQLAIPLLIKAGIQLLTALAEGIDDFLPNLIQQLVDMMPMLVKSIIDGLPLIFEAGIAVLMALIEGIVEALPELIPVLVDMMIMIQNILIDNLPLIVDAAIKLVGALILGLIQATPELIQAAIDLTFAMIDSFLTLVETFVTMGADFVKWLIEGFKGEFDDFFEEAKYLGVNIVEGFWDGIVSLKDDLSSRVKDFFGGIIDSAKGVLQIFSPSRVFRRDIGQNVVKGAIMGLDDEEQDLNNKVADVFGQMVGVAENEIDATMSSSMSAQTATRQTLNANMVGVMEVDGRKLGRVAFEYLDDNNDLAFGRG